MTGSGYRDVSSHWYAQSLVLQGLLGLSGIIAAISAAFHGWTGSVLESWLDAPPTVTEIDRLTRLEDLVLWSTVVVTIVTGLLFAAWLFVAHRSDRLAVDRRRHRSFWALVAWFIPVVNLVLPARVVNDVRRASQPESNPPARNLLGAWWASLLVGGSWSRVAADDMEQAATPSEIDTALTMVMVSDGLFAVAAVLAILLVRETAERIRTSPYAPAPEKAPPAATAS